MKILLTGANGYIGTRLLPLLIEKGHTVYALTRSPHRIKIPHAIKSSVKIVIGDLLKLETIQELPKDIDAAYYLVHSMSEKRKGFSDLEKKSAINFVDLIKKTDVKQVIYLSGLMSSHKLSPHLSSRLEVEKIIKNSSIPYTILRAGVIIGSGSASFEIIRDLVEHLPIMVAPKWVSNYCQPIAVFDALKYLASVLNHEKCLNQTFDIGGPTPLTYKEMLLTYADVRGLKRYIISVPVLTPRLSSYWLILVTSTNFSLASSLVESLKCDAICKEFSIKEIFPWKCLTYKEAVEKALEKIDQNAVVSSWKDALVQSRLNPDFSEYINVPTHGCVKIDKEIPFTRETHEIIENIWTIGGYKGWYYMDWAWGVRGFIDKLFGGVGRRRGRTNPKNLESGDALDFWRVLIADKAHGHLLLYAEMKLPGEAWLEFRILHHKNQKIFKQTASFRPKGISGRLYWYSLYPIHQLIFHGMANAIVND